MPQLQRGDLTTRFPLRGIVCMLGLLSAAPQQGISGEAAKIVAGSANNQLLEPEHGNLLHQMGIIYAPDYIINAGGLINISHERNPQGYSRERALIDTEKIYERLKNIINISKKDNIPTYLVADKIAEKRINN